MVNKIGFAIVVSGVVTLVGFAAYALYQMNGVWGLVYLAAALAVLLGAVLMMV